MLMLDIQALNSIKSILTVTIALRRQLRASILDLSKVTELPSESNSLTIDHEENVQSPGSKQGQSSKMEDRLWKYDPCFCPLARIY